MLSTTIMVFDRYDNYYDDLYFRARPHDFYLYDPEYRHTNDLNNLFEDGHAKWMSEPLYIDDDNAVHRWHWLWAEELDSVQRGCYFGFEVP